MMFGFFVPPGQLDINHCYFLPQKPLSYQEWNDSLVLKFTMPLATFMKCAGILWIRKVLCSDTGSQVGRKATTAEKPISHWPCPLLLRRSYACSKRARFDSKPWNSHELSKHTAFVLAVSWVCRLIDAGWSTVRWNLAAKQFFGFCFLSLLLIPGPSWWNKLFPEISGVST